MFKSGIVESICVQTSYCKCVLQCNTTSLTNLNFTNRCNWVVIQKNVMINNFHLAVTALLNLTHTGRSSDFIKCYITNYLRLMITVTSESEPDPKSSFQQRRANGLLCVSSQTKWENSTLPGISGPFDRIMMH